MNSGSRQWVLRSGKWFWGLGSGFRGLGNDIEVWAVCFEVWAVVVEDWVVLGRAGAAGCLKYLTGCLKNRGAKKNDLVICNVTNFAPFKQFGIMDILFNRTSILRMSTNGSIASEYRGKTFWAETDYRR